MQIYLFMSPTLCLKRAFRNLGRKLENGARTLIGKEHKFNPYKRGFTNSKEGGAKLLESLYDYNTTKTKTDRMNHELQKLASKAGVEIDDVEVNKNWFRKVGDMDDTKSDTFSSIGGYSSLSDVLNDGDGEDSCVENLLRIRHLLESKQEDDGSLGIDSLQSLRQRSVDSIEIFPGDVVTRKEVITISRNS